MFIKLKAGEPLNRSNYRLFADIFVNIIAAVLLLQRLQYFLLIVCFIQWCSVMFITSSY